MIIGVNGRFLVAKRTGVQRAAYNLIRSLIGMDRENQYVIFSSEEQKENSDWSFPNVKVVGSSIKEGDNLRNHLWEQFVLPQLAKKYKVDILHCPANTAPLLYKGPVVLNIYDLCFVVNPLWYSFAFRTLYKLLIPRLARKAACVITNSNNSRNDLFQYCKLQNNKVRLVYLAVDDVFFKSPPNKNKQLEEFPYILYVGSLEPRKNIGILVEAYEKMRLKYPEIKHKLLLIGAESSLFKEARYQMKYFPQDIVFKGFVDDRLLKDCYGSADLVAYPSLYEGFGLPPLEAMACGAPVVTSSTSSLPEVVGDAAIMINPLNSNELADGMAKVLSDPELKQRLIAKGYERVQLFNWYAVARKTLQVFEEVYSREVKENENADAFKSWESYKDLEKVYLKNRSAFIQ